MQAFRSIRSQLLLLVLVVALPLLGLVLYVTASELQREAEQVRMAALSLAQLEAANVEQVLSDAENLLARVAERPVVRAAVPEQCDPFLQHLPDLFAQFAGLGIVDASGQTICSAAAGSGSDLPLLADREWFQTVKRTGAFTVGDVQVGRITGRWVSVLAYPIQGEDGQFLGALVMPIDLVRFQTALDQVTISSNTTITVLDRNGTVVARSSEPKRWIGQNMRGQEVVDAVLDETVELIRAEGFDGEDRLYGVTDIPKAGWHVYASVPTSVAFAPVRALLFRHGLLSLAVVLAVTVLVGLFKRQVEQPIRSLVEVAEAVADGRHDQRAPVTGPKEFAEVAAQFNHMLDVRERHTAQVERHARQRETLGRLGQAVASSLDLPVLLDRVIQNVAQLLSAEGVSVWIVEGTELHCVAALEESTIELKNGRLPLEATVAGSVVSSGTSIWVEDVTEQLMGDDPFVQIVVGSDPHIRTLQVAPLELQGTVVGVIQATHSQPGVFNAADQQLLESAASWTAIAIGNARQHEQLRWLTQRLISAQEEERKYLAQELHDEAGQMLTVLRSSLALLQEDLSDATGEVSPEYNQGKRIQVAIDLADEILDQLRLLSRGLRPPAFNYTGLNPALETLCQEFAEHAGLSIEYTRADLPELPESISISFYRFLQEALTNVAKHAEAANVEVALSFDGEMLSLRIHDDGKGFDVNAKLASSRREGIGLLGMQERIRLLDGECQIESVPGEGTRLVARCRIRLYTDAAPVAGMVLEEGQVA